MKKEIKEEIWRDIKDYEGKYQVSNFGVVKSLNYNRTGKEKVMTPQVRKDGYLEIGLRKNGKKNHYLVHRLVANVFILNKEDFKYVDEKDRLKYVDNLDKLEVNHKDEHPENNNVDNLEWCTSYYNHEYGTRTEKQVKTQSKKVIQYDLEGNLIRIWPSAYEIERQLGFAHGNISKCCRGELKHAYGFKWCYVD